MTPEERIYPMFTERVKPMSLREDVDAIRPGDTVTVRFEYCDPQKNVSEFDIIGVAWKTVGRSLCIGDRFIRYGGGDISTSLLKVVNRIPGKPEWHDAQVISAMIHNHVGRRYLLNDRRVSSNKPWARAFCGDAYYYTDEQLSDVIIIVDKDGKTCV